MRLILASAIMAASAAATTLVFAFPASAETKSYNLSGFKKIEAEAGFSIEFTQSPTWSVVVDSRRNTLDMIVIEKVGDTLRIKRPKNTRNVEKVEDIVRISAPDLEELELDAAIKFTAQKLNVDKLEIEGSAAVSVSIADLRVDRLKVDLDAASKLVVSGTCAKLVLTVDAAASADTKGLKCREADIDAGVASKVHAFASERAVAKAGVSSKVLISGKPASFQKSEDTLGSSVSLAD